MAESPKPILGLVKRVRVKLVVPSALAAAAALALFTAGAQGSATRAAAAGAPAVKLEQTSLGEILVDGAGQTLFLFTRDRHHKDSCAKVPGCLETWPALTTTRRAVAGPGVRTSLLGTIKLHGHVRQVTYGGHPLYTYALGFAGKFTYNIGSDEYGGTWEAVNAAGEAVS